MSCSGRRRKTESRRGGRGTWQTEGEGEVVRQDETAGRTSDWERERDKEVREAKRNEACQFTVKNVIP
jgi:hypothetical protein